MASFRKKKEEPVKAKPEANGESTNAAKDVEKGVANPVSDSTKPIDYSVLLSTGSTLLDLAISGGRSRYGGIPGGILIEIFGASGGGKTAIMSEIMGSALAKNGKIQINDPEGRLDQEYAKIYGVSYDKDIYDRPDTVVQAFKLASDFLQKYEREKITDPINVCGTDSIAALSTELELEKGDKMGQKRAKDFSQELRKIARTIANSGNLLICTNQVRQGEYGYVTPGGMAPEFYASLRLHVKRMKANDVIKVLNLKKAGEEAEEMSAKKLKKEKKEKAKIERTLGICSEVYIQKSTVDAPYRSAPVFLMFGYGVDDVRANLQWFKDMTVDTMYECPDGFRAIGIEQGIKHIEDANLESQLKEKVVDLWHDLESQFSTVRKPKVR